MGRLDPYEIESQERDYITQLCLKLSLHADDGKQYLDEVSYLMRSLVGIYHK